MPVSIPFKSDHSRIESDHSHMSDSRIKTILFSQKKIGLVIDGSIAIIPFNDGAKVLLEVHPEDALLTAVMDDR